MSTTANQLTVTPLVGDPIKISTANIIRILPKGSGSLIIKTDGQTRTSDIASTLATNSGSMVTVTDITIGVQYINPAHIIKMIDSVSGSVNTKVYLSDDNIIYATESKTTISTAIDLLVPDGDTSIAAQIAAAAPNPLIVTVDDGTTGQIQMKSKVVTKTLTNARTNNIALQVPSGAILVGASLRNDTIIAGLDDATSLVAITGYTSLYNTGATAAIGGTIALTKNAKTNAGFDPHAATPITSAATDVTVDAGVGNKFTAGGKITAIVYYYELTSITNAV